MPFHSVSRAMSATLLREKLFVFAVHFYKLAFVTSSSVLVPWFKIRLQGRRKRKRILFAVRQS